MYKTAGTKYDFNRFLFPLKFTEKIHNYEITLDEAINYQTELEILINKLNNDCNPINPRKWKRKTTVYNLQENCLMREKILLVFSKNNFFV